MIRFLLSDVELPRPPKATIDTADVGSQRSTNRSGPPSNVSEVELLDQVSELPGLSPVVQTRGAPTPILENPGTSTTPAMGTTQDTGPSTFRGRPVNINMPTGSTHPA